MKKIAGAKINAQISQISNLHQLKRGHARKYLVICYLKCNDTNDSKGNLKSFYRGSFKAKIATEASSRGSLVTTVCTLRVFRFRRLRETVSSGNELHTRSNLT